MRPVPAPPHDFPQDVQRVLAGESACPTMIPETFDDSVRFLFSLGHELKVVKWDLERMRILLGALGDPQRQGRFVHVAGTNGKGSTCAMIEAALRTNGLRTGLYTSPHLVSPRER